MSMGVNKVMLIGNVGKDPEVRYTANGMAVANISIATSESWKDKNNGEKKEAVEWHRVVFFDKLAEIVSEYVKKGTKIYVEGKLKTRKWQDKETGQDRYATDIHAASMQLLGSRSEQENKGQANKGLAKAQTAEVEDDFLDIPF